MRVDDPRHGSRAGRVAGCDCPACVAANNAYCKQYRNRRYGRDSVLADATRARQHLIAMRAHYSTVALAKLVGGNSSWICHVIAGTHERMTPAKARRILAIRPGMDAGTSWVAAWPTQRRAQALAAMGWSLNRQADQIGYKRQNMAALVAGKKPYITSRVDQAMRAFYDAVSMTSPTAANHFEVGGITKAKKQAAREGWIAPLGWLDIDDVHERPDTGWQEYGATHRPKATTVEDFDWLVSQGESPEQAAARLGVTVHAVRDYRRAMERVA